MTHEDHIRHEQIVRAAAGHFAKKYTPQPKDLTEAVTNVAMSITTKVREQIKPVLAAGGWKDKEALRDLVTRAYLEHFVKLSKDELEDLCTMLHVEIFMEGVEANPWGKDKPDVLSGL